MPSIAIDFDEVLANSMEYALSKHNALYPNSHLSSSDITTFSWESIDSCGFHTYQESVEFWRSTLNEASFDYITPIGGSQEVVDYFFKNGWKLIVVTARPNTHREAFIRWCEKYFAKAFSDYVMLGDETGLTHGSKGVYAKMHNIEYAIDDGAHNIEEYQEHGVHAYCLDKPWNRNAPLPLGIRCSSLEECKTQIYSHSLLGKSL